MWAGWVSCLTILSAVMNVAEATRRTAMVSTRARHTLVMLFRVGLGAESVIVVSLYCMVSSVWCFARKHVVFGRVPLVQGTSLLEPFFACVVHGVIQDELEKLGFFLWA